ncbi:MAG TPA: NAD(P)/FAD-dependent oxidoreductase [Anaerolineales bacterium]|nr:NAD(P)/FAD-dependent oxidoreductase [Anaerolineales bacterium]HMX20210.1 NAD(P)/FAD-dependent oxidoreductase [Anaerolineales bacterium]HMX73918.1 NAD(P)/FAD-dependent oxidoreductase [Anaerolineales bacterium]HMZ42757.1 NAD(P)/FAD-dependent oxidoreductase [Anaerolineales bacterium]HNA52959.1 NAD(P)/FAD-dependent oxidoreductase [Anaerolineales bacterium]
MKIAIVGAGYGGMVAAWDLKKAGHDVTIFESAEYAGGLASGFKEPHWDWSVEKFYHHWFQSDGEMLGLIRELGLEDKVRFPRPLTVMYYKGKWYPFDSILNALLFPGLGWGLNKIRFGFVGLFLRLTNNWRALEKVTADEWMMKYAGRQVYEQMWKPLLVGKFASFYKDVNMAWLWARMHARTTRLGTFEGGFQKFADLFAEKLRAQGVQIKLGVSIKSIKRDQASGSLLVDDQPFDKVLVTSSPSLMAKLCPDLPESYLKGLLGLKSMGAVVMTLSLAHPLSKEGYYWFNVPKEEGYPFLALVEHTNFVPKENFGGDHIVYAGDYLELGHEYFSMSDEQLLERFIPAFQKFNPEFSRDWVKKIWVHKTNYAQPVPLVDHSKNIPEIQTPIEGLYFASMSQVYPWDRGTNFAVEIGRKAARMMK